MMNALIRCIGALVAASVVFALSSAAALADRRVALIIGNAEYQHADTLVNTINDADAMTQLFKRAGFDVVDERKNVGVVEFKRAVREFLNTTQDADIAVVYYSGHGIEVGGANYLIPIDAKLLSAFDVDDEAVPLDRVLLSTQPARRLSLIILDACRENPFLLAQGRLPATRSVSARLIGVEPTNADTLVAYAAKAGSVSYDGAGPNSPFTTALVKYLTQPGLDIRIALGKVRDEVLASTNNAQEPFVYGSLGGSDISLAPAPSAPSAPDLSASIIVDFQMAERLETGEGWRAFLAAHGEGYYAELARAHLAKLSGEDSAQPSPPLVSASRRPTPEAQKLAARPAEPADEGGKSVEPQQAAPAAAQTPEPLCERERSRLQELRENPSLSAAKDFAGGLQCEGLRPQLDRLLESLGAEPSPRESGSVVASRSDGLDCEAGAQELQRLRANPTLDQVTEFARNLRCDQLRPQIQRLMESLGASPIASDAASKSRDATNTGPTTVRADGAAACDREAAELSRIRANPDAAVARRFASQVKCERLKAQVARLLESLGD
jgi:hypothetical protein